MQLRTMIGRNDRLALAALVAIVAICCGWILSLPLFPSEDGPVHVYYAAVTRSLLAGEGTYADGFRVAHRLPPYSLHAYLLMGMMRWISGVMAEKVLACLCLIAAASGFAYFARQLGRGAGVVALLAIPFFLHRYFFVGFYGFSAGVGLALLAMGIWCRTDRFAWKRRGAFLAIAFLTSFTHPVPYVLLLAFCASEMVAAFVLRRRSSAFAKPTIRDVATLLTAALPVLYIAKYAHSGALWTMYSRAELISNLVRIGEILRMTAVAPLNVTAYQIALRVVFLLLLAVGGYHAWKDVALGRFTHAQLALAWGIAVLLAVPFAPDQLNGSYVFAERLSVWSVLLILVAAARMELEAQTEKAIVAAACIVAVFMLVMLNIHMRPIARDLDVSKRPLVASPGAHALLANRYSATPPDLTYDPYAWAGLRIVEQEKAILVSSPFLDLAIMMLQPTPQQAAQDKLLKEPERLAQQLKDNGLVVTARCGEPSREAWAKSYREWKDKFFPGWTTYRYSCFDVMRP